jgi:hypothetical protein
MAWKRNVLVVANVTATSRELVSTLQARAEREPIAFTLIVPATVFGGGRAAATEVLSAAIDELRRGGLEADGIVGAADPVVAVTDEWDPKRYDEIVVSTLPMRVSKWLHAGLPERIAKLTGAPVTHIVSEPPTHQDPSAPLGPLSVLGWGANKTQETTRHRSEPLR